MDTPHLNSFVFHNFPIHNIDDQQDMLFSVFRDVYFVLPAIILFKKTKHEFLSMKID